MVTLFTVFIHPFACFVGYDDAEEAVSCLKRSEELLLQHTKGVDQGSESAWENLSRIKDSAQDLNQQLVR